MFHFEIDEKNPMKPRYRVKDVLHKSPNYSKIFVEDSGFNITIYSGENMVRINVLQQLSPDDFQENFQLDFFYKGTLSLIVNGNDLLRYIDFILEPSNCVSFLQNIEWNICKRNRMTRASKKEIGKRK